ncbi:MAG: copper chaperone PCu(A)C [Congregibacter sp.]
MPHVSFLNGVTIAGVQNVGAAARTTTLLRRSCVFGLLLMLLDPWHAAMAASNAEDSAALVLSNAWIRAMPPTQKMTAAYVSLRNDSAEPIVITAVRSSLGEASLHETRVEGGRSSMRPVDTLRIDPGKILALKPGALHIMIMGLKRVPAEGESSELCMVSNTRDFCVDAPVQRSLTVNASPHASHP